MRREISIDDPPPGGHEFSWVRRLAAAILHRAVMDAAHYKVRTSRPPAYKTQRGNEAWDYVMNNSLRGPFSFNSLCLILDMNPTTIRKKIESDPLSIVKAPVTRPGSHKWDHPDVKWDDEDICAPV